MYEYHHYVATGIPVYSETGEREFICAVATHDAYWARLDVPIASIFGDSLQIEDKGVLSSVYRIKGKSPFVSGWHIPTVYYPTQDEAERRAELYMRPHGHLWGLWVEEVQLGEYGRVRKVLRSSPYGPRRVDLKWLRNYKEALAKAGF